MSDVWIFVANGERRGKKVDCCNHDFCLRTSENEQLSVLPLGFKVRSCTEPFSTVLYRRCSGSECVLYDVHYFLVQLSLRQPVWKMFVVLFWIQIFTKIIQCILCFVVAEQFVKWSLLCPQNSFAVLDVLAYGFFIGEEKTPGIPFCFEVFFHDLFL